MSIILSNQLLLFTILAINLFLNVTTMDTKRLVSVNFEVFGRVQGVFFRKYTKDQAKALGLTGYCLNTEKGTVQGTIEGPVKNVNEMKIWLQQVGSPSSKIEKAVFTSEVTIKTPTANSFTIRR